MTGLPKISVITPTLNQGDYIDETIQSVINQEYPDLEYIIIDGGSTDQTLKILEKYRGKLKWISEKDTGQSNAINKGLKLATGDVLSYLNSDDIFENSSLQVVGNFFANHPQAYWLSGRCCIVNSNGEEIRRMISIYKNFWLKWASFPVLNILNFISQPATFWRKEVINSVGLFNENLFFTMDYDYWLRIGKKYRLWVLPITLAKFRIQPSSKTMYSTRSQFKEEMKTLRIHTKSELTIKLHALHNFLILMLYGWAIKNKEERSND